VVFGAQLPKLPPERGAPRLILISGAKESKFSYMPAAVSNTASIATAGMLNYTEGLQAFLHEDATLASKETKMSDISREEIQAHIAASEARGDTRIARLEGKIDTLAATLVGKIDALQSDIHRSDSYNRDTRLITISTVIVAAIALAGLMVTMASYGDAMFGRGMNVQDIVKAVIKENAAIPANKGASNQK
jgi:hypothetical protein